ncbi:hypothetical protein ACPEEZ_00550 [Frigoribacterium sp. 2-23]|uniref:hypothetical protein n=1 Tax=Frigoribacterium sp. 2-23 TaxID=3415006 RepID=UPI003C6F5EAA
MKKPQRVATPHDTSALSQSEAALLDAARSLEGANDWLLYATAALLGAVCESAKHDRAASDVFEGIWGTDVDESAVGAVQLSRTADWLAAVWETVPLESVVGLLHLPPERIMSMIGQRSLLAIEFGDELRFPTWQFSMRPGTHLLPHLDKLLPRLLSRWDPVALGVFFFTPYSELAASRPKSPADWLDDNGDPEMVRRLINNLDPR